MIMEHEMGELFKVLALGAGDAWEPWGLRAETGRTGSDRAGTPCSAGSSSSSSRWCSSTACRRCCSAWGWAACRATSVRLFGRDWFIPLASTVLLSFVVSLIAKWV
jgi:hypothetical protein